MPPSPGLEARVVVVTGGAGFIGSHVVDALVRAGARVRVIDDLSSGFRQFLNPQTELCESSLLDYSRIHGVFAGAELVFHLAANADVRHGLAHPRKDVEQNLLATHNVLEAMREHRVMRIAFSSTGAVYGDAAVLPTPEDAPFPLQTSLYGASKLAAEGLLSAYAHGYGFRASVFRFVSMLGPRYTHGHVFDFWRKLRHDPTQLEVRARHVARARATDRAGEGAEHRSLGLAERDPKRCHHLPHAGRVAGAQLHGRRTRLDRRFPENLAGYAAAAGLGMGAANQPDARNRRNASVPRGKSVLCGSRLSMAAS